MLHCVISPPSYLSKQLPAATSTVLCVSNKTGAAKFAKVIFHRNCSLALRPLCRTLKRSFLTASANRLLNPHLESFIRRAKKLMPASGWIGFQSNGVLMTNLRAVSLIDAGLDKVCISVDAIAPEQFRKLREGGEVDAVDMALSALNNARTLCNRPEVKIGIEFVAMRSNISELPATLEWAASRGASFAIVTHVLPYDELHAHEAVFCNITDQALALYNSWRRKAINAGIDIQRYSEVRWKYARTEDEQAVVDMVEAMKAEAEQQGIMLDIKKLLQLEHQRLDEITAIFAAAEDVANKTGLELRLPEVALKEQRKCSFVEEGSAFVSWNGDISPCYFLWHRYECFASGWNQTVKPKDIRQSGPSGYAAHLEQPGIHFVSQGRACLRLSVLLPAAAWPRATMCRPMISSRTATSETFRAGHACGAQGCFSVCGE